MRRGAALALIAFGCAVAVTGSAFAAPRIDSGAPSGWKVDRVVLLMRHGVRPPTKQPPMPARVAAQEWPSWPVAPGWLTPHGAAAVARLGSFDREGFRAQGLLPASGCPAPGTVAVIADSDQRTIATAEAWLAALAPGCNIASAHKPQDEPDPLFNGVDANATDFDPAKANAAVAAAIGPGGIRAVERTQQPLLARLDHILCGTPRPTCGVGAEPSAIVPATEGKRPKLSGALDRASTAAQILLLEYAEGKAVTEVGWGRATSADVTALSAFHALEFRLLARPRYIAAANLRGLAERMIAALEDPHAIATITMISGHDTQIANLGGLLGVHWRVAGFAADDPAPGGAIVIERLTNRQGSHVFRASYRSQSLDEIRLASPLHGVHNRVAFAVPGCRARGVTGLCSLDDLKARLLHD